MSNAELVTTMTALHPECYAWAMTCCDRNREDAEDVLHDVYLGVIDGRLRHGGRSSVRTWLFGVIRRVAWDRRRRTRLRALLRARNVWRVDAPARLPGPDDALDVRERRAALRSALGRLSARQREVLMLVFYHELTVDESAAVMGVSVGAARVHYDRGKRRLAALLCGDAP